jgi:oligosaccharide repeat unit polymerase
LILTLCHLQSFKYVAQEGYLYGQQLLGAIFTFIPRESWESKPVITGLVLVEALNGEFWNVSTGIIGEAYIDFGMLGVLLYGLILGLFSVIFDYFLRRPYLLYAQGIAYIALGLVFFNLRGALLTTIGYTYGGLAAVTVVYVIIVATRGIHQEVLHD